MEEAWQKRPLVALVGFQGLILKCASETLNLFIRPLKNNHLKGDAGRKNPHSPRFSGRGYHCLSKASRREDLQVEEPVSCRDCSSFHFHATAAGMLSAPLVGHEV